MPAVHPPREFDFPWLQLPENATAAQALEMLNQLAHEERERGRLALEALDQRHQEELQMLRQQADELCREVRSVNDEVRSVNEKLDIVIG